MVVPASVHSLCTHGYLDRVLKCNSKLRSLDASGGLDGRLAGARHVRPPRAKAWAHELREVVRAVSARRFPAAAQPEAAA